MDANPENSVAYSEAYRTCPVCIAMDNQVAHNPDEAAFDQACIELELHPNHRQGAITFAEKHPEWSTKVIP